ncbi:NUDIX domain-containing protein [Pseudomonas monteilii]|uniref:NUDIX domain-containing protein n=1 Tax=Pseudomonas monteilii TaxID=76759 RepID=UPI003CFF5122
MTNDGMALLVERPSSIRQRAKPMPGKKNEVIKARATVLCTQNGRLLLVRKKGGGWNFPGGAIESGETPEQAAVRELAEEVGLRADRLPLLCEVQVEGILHYIFTTHLHEHERPKPDNEIAACKWVLRSNLDRTELKSSAAALVATRLPLLCP